MLPRALCRLSVLWADGGWAVNYLTERDHEWLALLIAEYVRACGLPQGELRRRLAEPLPLRAPKGKRRLVEHVLDRLSRGPQVSKLPPREARQVLFTLAARQNHHRTRVLSEAAASLHVSPDALTEALFADLESERRVGELSPELTPAALARHTNLLLVEALLARARELRIVAPEHTQALVRHARSAGLLCVVHGSTTDRGRIYVSGPFSLFRQTRVYSRAFASLVRRTLAAPAFEITADCQLNPRGDAVSLVVGVGVPLGSIPEPLPRESFGERAFARDFQRLARGWELLRDPEPVAAGDHMVFADFELRRRGQDAPPWLVEIVGFWTRDYLLEKLARLRAAGHARVLVCVDTKRGCGAGDLPDDPQLIPFRRKVNAGVVLARLSERTSQV